MKSGIDLIADERERQILVEGWTPEHDATHKNSELAYAAVSYAVPHQYKKNETPINWPWAKKWYKPEDRIRNLVKAGALIAAEIDRLNNLKPPIFKRGGARR